MSFRRYIASAIIFVVIAPAILALACGGEPAAPTPTSVPVATAEPVAAATTAPAVTVPPAATGSVAATQAPPVTRVPTATAAPTATEPPPAVATEEPPTLSVNRIVFTIGDGTVARYKVEEVLANTGFKVATGETSDVSGSVALNPDDGSVIADASRIVMQAATLRTDSDRRDGYVRNRTLQTDTYPEVVFRPTSIDGLPWPVGPGTAFPADFTITGDLTVRDQTREVAWDATVTDAGPTHASGTAGVEFTFDDFGMDKPRVAIVVSVEDTIRLELDFAMTVSLE